MTSAYLDNAATTPLASEVVEAIEPFLRERFGNPSSRHGRGVDAARAVSEAREKVARLAGARTEGVVFTSGGTEANNLGVLGLARAGRGKHVLVGPTEHSCVRESARALEEEGYEVERLRLDTTGGLDLEDARARLRPDTVLVAQMLVSNELGTIYPVARLARIVRAGSPRARVHVDAVQGVGKLDATLADLGVDSLALSAHKFHGPKGAGALVLRDGVKPRPLVYGGGQEHGLRSGTENVPGIVGLGAAAELAERELARFQAHAATLRARLVEGLARIKDARVLEAAGSEGVTPTIVPVLLPGPPAEVWQHHLETRGVQTSVGAACQAKRGGVSATLAALGLDEDGAKRVLRISFSRLTTAAELDAGLDALAAVAEELRAHA